MNGSVVQQLNTLSSRRMANEVRTMAEPKETTDLPLDPYVDPIPHNPGEPVPQPETEAPDWPEGQVPPEEQSDG